MRVMMMPARFGVAGKRCSSIGSVGSGYQRNPLSRLA